jgi:adenylate cyclase
MSACTACGHANAEGAKFCIECGVPMARSCPSCSTQVTASQKFCGECGQDLRTATAPAASAPARPVESERKQVTVLFADLAGSMDLAERFDPDEWTQIITGLFEAGAEAVHRFGGTVDKFTGDGLMALFGAPIALEDHATRAAHAALALTAAARVYADKVRDEHKVELCIRVGLNSGEVVAGTVGDSGFTAVGHTVGLAQRMESLADAGTIRVTEHSARLLGDAFSLRDLGAVAVKGASAPVQSYALDATGSGVRRRATTGRLVGRDPELGTLLTALESAEAGRAQVIGIVGEAGAGKSRLTEEIARTAADRDLLVLRTAGVSHATNVPLLPIQNLFRDYFGMTDTDSPTECRAKIAEVVLGLDPGFAEDLPVLFDFFEVPDPDAPVPPRAPEARRRRVLEVLRRVSRRRSEKTTLLLILEDLHWFDPPSVEFVAAWLPVFPNTRTLVVINFRPEFHASWMGQSYYRQLSLPPLTAAAVHELSRELVGDDPSLRTLTEDLAERAGGNPFFTEEILRSWTEDGTLVGQPGDYRLGRAADQVLLPPTVQAVLADRIDRLTPRQKRVLQTAAVIGRVFTVPVLAMASQLAAAALTEVLDGLCAAELIQTAGIEEYRFWNPLTQEVAYSTLLGATRRANHRAVAEAIVASFPMRQDELAALIATHFEAAGDHEAVAQWQFRASMRSMFTDFEEAATRLRSTIGHLAEVPRTPQTTALEVGALSQLMRLSARTRMSAGEGDQLIAAAVPLAERLQDPSLLARVRIGEGAIRYWAGEHELAVAAYREAARWADSLPDLGLQAFAHHACTVPSPWTGPVPEALARCEHVLTLCDDDPTVGAEYAGYCVLDVAHTIRSLVHLAGGELDRAGEDIDRGLRGLEQRPFVQQQMVLLAPVLLAEVRGDERVAESAAEGVGRQLHLARENGDVWGVVRAMLGVAVVHLRRGEPTDARRILEEALSEARTRRCGLQDETTLVACLARAHLALGNVEPARERAAESIAVARRQGAPVVECLAHLTQAQVLRGTSMGERDDLAAGAALDTGEHLADRVGASTWAAFLAEERARLSHGDLAAVAAGYDAIGATGHAARIRAELAP